MSIVKWKVSNWLSAPERVEYTKQTTHFYIKTSGGRDSIICRYYSYFDSEADALAFIEEKKAQRLHAKNVDRIKSHGVELFYALELVTDGGFDPDSGSGSWGAVRITMEDWNIIKGAIAKAKGTE